MFSNHLNLGAVLILAMLLPGSSVSAKEKKDKDVTATVKLYEDKARKKTEQKLNVVCKTDNGDIVAPATLTYTVDPADACEISPASGTESKDGKWEVTFKYKKPGTCKVTFGCGDKAKKMVIKVESIEKPKKVITGPDADEPPPDPPQSGDDSEKTFKMVQTQDALAEAYMEVLAQPPIAGAANPQLFNLMVQIVNLSPMPPLEPADVDGAMIELQNFMGAERIVPDMFPATEVLLELYDEAATRFFQSLDCNGNGAPDFEDLANGRSVDANGDLVSDDCSCRAVIFDADGDHDVDQTDFAEFQACMTGPKVAIDVFNALPLSCRCMDVAGADFVEPDGAVDQRDFAFFQSCMTGPAIDVSFLGTHCDGY